LVGLTSTGQYDDDLDRFTIVSLLAFAASFALLCRLLDFSPAATVVAAVAYSLCFSPMLADLRAVNVNQVQLLFLSLFLWWNHRQQPALAGAVLGFGIAFKPNIASVLLVAIFVAIVEGRLTARARLFAGVAAGAAAGVAVAAVYFGGFDVWRLFFSSVGRTLQNGYPVAQGNYALAGLIPSMSSVEVSAVVAVLAMAALLFVLWRTKRLHETGTPPLDEQFLTVGLGCVMMLLGSQLVWIHYYVLLIPLSLYLLRPTGDTGWFHVGPLAAGLALLLLSPAAQSRTGLFGAVTANIAIALLFSAGLVSWWAIRTGARAAHRSGRSATLRQSG
jgi:hypothetical protein